MNIETKHIVDLGAVSVAFAGFLGYMPNIATGLSVIWLCMQIYKYCVNKEWKRRDRDS